MQCTSTPATPTAEEEGQGSGSSQDLWPGNHFLLKVTLECQQKSAWIFVIYYLFVVGWFRDCARFLELSSENELERRSLFVDQVPVLQTAQYFPKVD